MTNHHNVNHLGKRDFICTYPDCNRAFGYKHLLQRHLTRVHVPESEEEDGDESGAENERDAATPQPSVGFSIDDLTGMSYQTQVRTTAKLECPYPDVSLLVEESIAGSSAKCQYVFTRAYDLRRHLKSEHGLDVEKEKADEWVVHVKKTKAAACHNA